MKLPLTVGYHRRIPRVVDADSIVVCELSDRSGSARVAKEIVRRFNGDWRWRFFGMQPFVCGRD